MRPIVLTTLFATMLLGGAGGAFAQSIEVAPDEPFYEDYDRSPQVYRYRSGSPAYELPIRPASCGEFRYWDGNSCVDARIVPPDTR